MLPIKRIVYHGAPATPNVQLVSKVVNPRVYLKSGASLSIQASEHTYCTPQNNDGPYTEVEVGYVNGPVPEAWRKYAEDNNLNETVFKRIPLDLVMFYIGANGGIDSERSYGLLKSWDLALK